MKRRKLFYVPGLISLIGLPVLLLVRRPEDRVQQVVMKVVMTSDAEDQGGILQNNRAGVLRMIKGKRLISLLADDRPSHLYPEANPYRGSVLLLNEMARQQFTQDTNEVLRVTFDDRNDYGDFVWMLNITQLFRYGRYAFLDDALYLFANPPPPPPDTNSHDIPMLLADDIVAPPWTPPGSWELLWRRLKWEWPGFLYGVRGLRWLCIGFGLLIVLPCLCWIVCKRKPA